LNTHQKQLLNSALRLNIELDSVQLGRFQCYLDELVDWNGRVNLTAITDCHEVQIKHFLDSLTVAAALPAPPADGYRIIDVGSGAGFPGLPLKIAFPQIEMTLLEATGKKCAFLRHISTMLGLNVNIINMRAEEAAHLPEYRGQFDTATARGLASMAALAELTLPFLRMGGLLVAQKKGALADELKGSERALKILGGAPYEVHPLALPEFPDGRCLVIVKKIAPTPENFPRRSGLPSKKPLT